MVEIYFSRHLNKHKFGDFRTRLKLQKEHKIPNAQNDEQIALPNIYIASTMATAKING